MFDVNGGVECCQALNCEFSGPSNQVEGGCEVTTNSRIKRDIGVQLLQDAIDKGHCVQWSFLSFYDRGVRFFAAFSMVSIWSSTKDHDFPCRMCHAQIL
jgi:hypothetical protein